LYQYYSADDDRQKAITMISFKSAKPKRFFKNLLKVPVLIHFENPEKIKLRFLESLAETER
jgi:hypothetical protein